MATTPFRVSERFSSQDLTGGDNPPPHDRKRKRSTMHSQEIHGPASADMPRLSTPDPRTPGTRPSDDTPPLTIDVSSAATVHSATSVLTEPDDNDEDDGIVRGVAIVNPFADLPSYNGVVFDELDSSSLFSDNPAAGSNNACELLGSVQLGYRRTLPSQDRELECGRPLTKKRRTEAPPQTERRVTAGDGGKSAADAAADATQDEGASKVAGPADNGERRTPHAAEEDLTEIQEQTEELEDDPDYETNSNWDRLEAVQDRLKEYNTFKRTIKGYDRWTPAQAKLHKLLALRGCWPMFQHSWALNFSIRNIYPQVFAPPPPPPKRVAVSARTNEFRATRALEAVFDLSALVRSYRQSGAEDKIGGVLRKALRRYVAWAAYDAGVEDRAYLPTLQVYEFDPRRWAAKARAAKQRTAAAAEAAEVEVVKAEPSSDWDDSSSDGGDLDSDPISDEVEKRLQRLAARHRRDLLAPESRELPEDAWTYREEPPLLFAFVIVQHMVMVVSLDPSRLDNEIVVFSELDMSLADQWLWNALAIALPVHMARDALWERRERLPVVERMDIDDPDL